MAQLDTSIIVVIVLASVIVVLLITIAVAALLLVYRRRLWCFKRRLDQQRLLQSDLERYGPVRKKQRYTGKARVFGKSKAKHKRRARKNKKKKEQSVAKAPRFPHSDPFTNKFLENPLIADDEFDIDWTNPAFDREAARLFDAVIIIQSWYRMIRVRVPYLQLREATVLAQSIYRGIVVRRSLPQLKKEKQIRDQQRKKQAGWKKKGTLAALKFFDVKGYGFAEVEQMYGLETTRSAAEQLRSLYGGKGQMKLKLFISVKGIKLFDQYTMKHYATVRVSSVSFCTLDPKNKKLFAFINKKRRRKFCHVFQANEQDAQKMVETMAEAFEFTYKRVERRKEQRERERIANMQKKKVFNRKNEELDVEVASMIELAETASITAGSMKRSNQEEAAGSSQSETSLCNKSTENLLSHTPPQRHSRSSVGKESGLTRSHKSRPHENTANQNEEAFDPRKVDVYFTDISEDVQDLASTLERESKKAAKSRKKLPRS